jgi:hypothetical protein
MTLAFMIGVLGAIAGSRGEDETVVEPEAAASPGESELARLPEGAILTDQPGTFQLVGKRMVFGFEGDARQLAALENLALERIVRIVRQTATPQSWLVSGTVTEYQGNNYLLIDRAVIRRAGESP